MRALSEINCAGSTCDTSAFTAESESDESDYVIDSKTRYFINVPTPTAMKPGRYAPLDYSDTTFIARFRNGEVWRLYSQEANVEGKNYEIIVGHQEKAPSKIETPLSQIGIVDVSLRRDANQIAAGLTSQRALSQEGRNALGADGFAVVDAKTKQVTRWGFWLPEFLPEDVRLPPPGRQFYIYDGDLYLLQTDTNGRVLASSFVQIGSLWWIAGSCGIVFLVASIIAHLLGRRFLRGYFAATSTRVPALEEALRAGEGQSVEFKRAISDAENKSGSVEDEVLKSIAAFANTNVGVIFIGIDDAGHVKGLGLDFTQKDRLERKIRQLVRNRIKPTPPFQINFEEVRGLVVARIVVARGEDPAYLMSGVIYVRYGSADVQAQPEDLRRLVSECAS